MKVQEKIEMLEITALVPYARNSRIHSKEQVVQIARSIQEFGFTNPVLVDAQGGIVAGHGRVLAAQSLGVVSVPCLRVDWLTEAQKKAYVIADNQLALNAGWDAAVLADELHALQIMDFDLELMGFGTDELTAMLTDPSTDGETDKDAMPEVQTQVVTKKGNIWVLGKHRLMCGDSTNMDAVKMLINGIAVDMVLTDPPYGISIVSRSNKVGGGGAFGGKKNEKQGRVGSSNRVEANIYDPVIGDDSIDTAIKAIQLIKTLSAKVEIIWGGNYYAAHLPNSSCWIVWDKKNSGNFADCELAWTNQKTAVRKFEHMWNGMLKASEHGQRRVHPTQKPIALAEWCLENYGKECKTVLDLFGGSGFSLIACEIKGKSSYVMELSEAYVDVIVRRWQDFIRGEAVLEGDGRTFNQIAESVIK